jgi:uncharacterized protein YecE (DUF72 family)
LKLSVGCSGWSFAGWIDHFYPKGLESKKYLEYYSRVFDYVEIESSFYRIPKAEVTQKWSASTPEKFRFTAKMTQAVTHRKRLGEAAKSSFEYFCKCMEPLQEKLGAILIQLPPSLTMKEGLKKLKGLPLDSRFRYAVEPRHKTWFDDEVYDYFRENDVCLVWSQRDESQTPPVVTTDFVYLRLMGDMSIPDTEFGRIQKDRTKEMRHLADRILELQKDLALKSGFVIASNHYAGFGPETANIFLKMLGHPQVSWHETTEKKQPTMLDFR